MTEDITLTNVITGVLWQGPPTFNTGSQVTLLSSESATNDKLPRLSRHLQGK
jgi:hypothetical protein